MNVIIPREDGTAKVSLLMFFRVHLRVFWGNIRAKSALVVMKSKDSRN